MNGRTNSSDVTIEEINYGALIPLEAPTDLQLAPLDKKATIRWEDPVDKYADPGGELASQWAYSIVVRKESSAPTSPEDGVLVLKTTTRNQYSSDVYTDNGNLNNTKLYYYAVYAYNTYDVPSEPVVSSVQPRDAILEFNQTLSNGLTKTTYQGGYYNSNSYWIDDTYTAKGSAYLSGASVGNQYALFAGGQINQGTSRYGITQYYTNTVDAFDASFTRSSASPLYAKCLGAIGVSTPTHAFFAGGWGGDTKYGNMTQIYSSASAYDASLTSHNIGLSCLYTNDDDVPNTTSTFENMQKCGASLGEYAIFQGMRKGSSFQTVNASLTISNLITANFTADGNAYGCEYTDGAVFIREGVVLKISPDLVTEVVSIPNIEMGYHGAGLCRCGDYIVGQGVTHISDSSSTTDWQAIDRWLTLRSLSTYNRYTFNASSTIGTYAVFATSDYDNSAGGAGLDGGGNPVISYNHSLTRATQTALSQGRHHGAVAVTGDNLLVAGGSHGYYSYGQNWNFYNTVDVYTIR